jgi:hypothetical protein
MKEWGVVQVGGNIPGQRENLTYLEEVMLSGYVCL